MGDYKRIEVNGNLESMVYTLLAAKARGELAYCEFGGVKLFSDTVSMDSAFLEVTGQTKTEFDKEMEEWRRKTEERHKMEQERAQLRITEWIEKGKTLIYPERHDEWKECVEIRAKDLYNGMELDASLEIMEALENGVEIEDVKKIFEGQGHSGMSESLVRNIIFTFSKKGPEFWESTAYGEISEENKKVLEEKKEENKKLDLMHSKSNELNIEDKPEIEKLKEQSYEVDFTWKYGNKIQDAVRELEEYRDQGKLVWMDFNGHKLYSCDVTLDSAYLEITGKTKTEFDKEMEEWRKKTEERQKMEQERAQLRIPEWIEKGKKIIHPERHDEWKKCVEIRAKDLYHGMELDAALEIMEALENNLDMEDVKKIFDKQGHSGMSASLVRNIVFTFSMKGPKFWESTAYGEISEETKKVLEEKKEENKKLEEKYAETQDQPEKEKMAKNDKFVKLTVRGQNVIYPERYEEWIECVKKRFESLYQGLDVEAALEIMEALEEGATMEEARQILHNQNHSNLSEPLVRNIIFNFSKRGPEFWEATASEEISAKDKEVLATKKRENEELEKNNQNRTKKTNI